MISWNMVNLYRLGCKFAPTLDRIIKSRCWLSSIWWTLATSQLSIQLINEQRNLALIDALGNIILYICYACAISTQELTHPQNFCFWIWALNGYRYPQQVIHKFIDTKCFQLVG